ncbi:delta-like protein 4 [Pocillopora verrucosa]|uniref:delta-like protein 4 n=1 Tax=Pocillopora verrucosa TaxID=203993 RepID=UPI003342AAFE
MYYVVIVFALVCSGGFQAVVKGSSIRKQDNPCYPGLCKNGGVCRAKTPDEGYGYYCLCIEGFGGDNCEIRTGTPIVKRNSPCFSRPCMNGGVCRAKTPDEGFGYYCLCPEGFRGKNCQEGGK